MKVGIGICVRGGGGAVSLGCKSGEGDARLVRDGGSMIGGGGNGGPLKNACRDAALGLDGIENVCGGLTEVH